MSPTPVRSRTIPVPPAGVSILEVKRSTPPLPPAPVPPPLVELPVSPVVPAAKPRRSRQSSRSKKGAEGITAEAFQGLSNDEILSLLLSLPRFRRQGLIDALEQFHELELEEMAAAEREELQQREAKATRRRERSARFEDKMINNCGPYRYFRWWDGVHYRSTYIGKTPATGS